MTGMGPVSEMVSGRVERFIASLDGSGVEVAAAGDQGRLNLLGLLGVMASGQRSRAGGALPERSLSPEVIDTILGEVAQRRGLPITPAQAQEVAELLLSGELFRDLGTGLAAALRLVALAPVAIVRDVLTAGQLPGDLSQAIEADLHDDPPRSPRAVLEDLRDGRLDMRRRILSNTLRVLLARANLALVISTVRSLIGPENQTFRLALIVYARSQGLDIDERDVQALLDALDPNDPDLGRLLDRGLERVREQYTRGADAIAFLRRIGAKAPA